MKKLYRAEQIEKAREKEKVVQAWRGGKKLSVLMKDAQIKLTRAQWWSLKKYKAKGFWGLIDGRRGGNAQKVCDEEKENMALLHFDKAR